MIIQPNNRQLSKLEKMRLHEEIKADLIAHWYKSIPIGALLAIFAASIFFVFLYKQTDTLLLTVWYIGLCLTIFLMVLLNFFYGKFKSRFSIQQWEFSLFFLVVITTSFWGFTIFFNLQDITQQFILLVYLFIAAASFSLVAVGMFVVCLISVGFVLVPVAIWFFLKDNFYYNVGGAVVLVYMGFVVGMNFRSTKWLINSLELSKMLASFTHQANYDLLTDLPNQRLLAQYIEEIILKVKATNENFALICFGINRLEVFNNSLGYQAGDLVINSVARRLESELLALNRLDKKTRILTRPRPDAFVILVVPVKLTDINKEVDQLFSALNEPFHLGDKESRLTASVGVTIFPQDSGDTEKLLSNTYAAMFEARSKGGNQTVFYKSALTSNAPEVLELENELHEALAKKELEVYYQPLIDLQKGNIAGIEALIRWNHPRRGMIPPDKIISVAEETGLIIPMSEWILEEAVIQTMLWQKQGFNNLKIAVNLSPKQLQEGNLIATIDGILKKTGLDPKKLELELTEKALLNESFSHLINEISKRGISLSIDDFGTGYSGLSYLKHFHVDKIKIDKSFIQDIVSNNDSAAIVIATLAMAKELGIKTLAEGVETKEQLEFLRARGCQYIQGYYFSKPLTAAALWDLLKQGISEKL